MNAPVSTRRPAQFVSSRFWILLLAKIRDSKFYLTAIVQPIGSNGSLAPFASIALVTVAPGIKSIWTAIGELAPGSYIRASTQSITTLAGRSPPPGSAANTSRWNHLQMGRFPRNQPVLFYWPKSVPRSSSVTLKLRFIVGVGNNAFFKVTHSCAAWVTTKTCCKEHRSLITL